MSDGLRNVGGVAVAGFPDVDHAPDPRALIEFMDTARTLPGVRIAKSVAMQALALRPGQAVADIGCGPGDDAVEMARWVGPTGSVIGIDASETMLAEARRRAPDGQPVRFVAGDVRDLPLPSESVDRCRADTVLQHVSHPAQAVAEMTRVTRTGGRIVLTDFDQGTFLVDHPDRATTTLVQQAVADGIAQQRVGRSLRRLLADAGALDITVQARFVESDITFLQRLLAPTLRELTVSGAVPGPVLDQWQAALAAASEHRQFTAGAVLFVAAGRLP